MTRIHRLSLAALVAVALSIAAPARAANVSVALQVDLGRYDAGATMARCAVSVEEGSDGVAVLERAERDGCIDSYETQTFSFGRFVSCINGVCGAPPEVMGITYWSMRENGELTDYGVDLFRATAGDELAFTYTTWATCLTPAGC